MRNLAASVAILASIFLTATPALADVWVKYSYNEWREGRIVKEDQWGVLVELKNALTGQYDPPGKGFQLYCKKNEISATKPADAQPQPGNAPGGMTAQVANAQFKPGQIVQFNDAGKMADGLVVRQDAYGVLVKARNWATGKFDGDAQTYHAADALIGGNGPAGLPDGANPANPDGGAVAVNPAQIDNAANPIPPVKGLVPDPKHPGFWMNPLNPDRENFNPINPMLTTAQQRPDIKGPADKDNPDIIPLAEAEFIDGRFRRRIINPAVNPVDPQQVNDPVPDPAKDPVKDPVQNPMQDPVPDQPKLAPKPVGPDGVPPRQFPILPDGPGGPPMTDDEVVNFLEERMPAPFAPALLVGDQREKIFRELQATLLKRGTTANYVENERKPTDIAKRLEKYRVPVYLSGTLRQNKGAPVKNDAWYHGQWDSTHVAKRNQGDIPAGKAGGLSIDPMGKYTWVNGDRTYQGNWRLATKPEMDLDGKGGVGIVLEDARGGRSFIVTEDDQAGNTVKEGIAIADIENRQDVTRAGR